MTASFIPVFTTYMRERTKEEVWDFANKLFWTLALVVAIITILGMVFSPFVVHLFAGKSAAGDQAVQDVYKRQKSRCKEKFWPPGKSKQRCSAAA